MLGTAPTRLGVLPQVWLLPPGVHPTPQPAGALLLSLLVPPPSLPLEAQLLLLRSGTGVERSLHLRVYCRRTGRLLLHRDRLQRDEFGLYPHPQHGVPTWDSG